MDSHAVVLVVEGSDDLLQLLDAARELRRDLFRLPQIASVDLVADPGEQLLIAIDPAVALANGLDAHSLAEQLAASNRTLAGGTLQVEGRSLVLNPGTEFSSLEELRDMPIRTSSGVLMPLAQVAEVTLTMAQPTTERMWSDGRPAVGRSARFLCSPS